MLHPSVVFGSVKPVLLHGMIIVESFSEYVCFIFDGTTPGQVDGHAHGSSPG